MSREIYVTLIIRPKIKITQKYKNCSVVLNLLHSLKMVLSIIRDVEKIRTRGYLRIKPATGRKWILKMDTRYPRVWVFLIPAC